MNIGFWLKKEFVNSVNQLSPDREDSCISYMQKNTVVEFNLTQGKKSLQEQDEIQQKVDEVKIYPIVAKRSYIILDLVKRLRAAPDVKRALNKQWANAKQGGAAKSGGADSIFDDFLGGGDSDSSSE